MYIGHFSNNSNLKFIQHKAGLLKREGIINKAALCFPKNAAYFDSFLYLRFHEIRKPKKRFQFKERTWT